MPAHLHHHYDDADDDDGADWALGQTPPHIYTAHSKHISCWFGSLWLAPNLLPLLCSPGHRYSGLRRIGMLRKWFCILNNVLGLPIGRHAHREWKKKRHCSQRSQSPRRASWTLQIEPKKGQKRLATHHQQQRQQHHHHSCRRLNLNPPVPPFSGSCSSLRSSRAASEP